VSPEAGADQGSATICAAESVTDRFSVIADGIQAIAGHLKATDGHFHPIAYRLNPIADGFYPITDRFNPIVDRKKATVPRIKATSGRVHACDSSSACLCPRASTAPRTAASAREWLRGEVPQRASAGDPSTVLRR